MPESVKTRGSSGPTMGATEGSSSVFSAASLVTSAMPGAYLQSHAGRPGSAGRPRRGARPLGGDGHRPLPLPRAAQLDAPHAAAVAAARAVIAQRRDELRAGADDEADLVARGQAALRPSLRRVLNATGVVLHTGLGRAVLSEAAQAAVAEAASGY